MVIHGALLAAVHEQLFEVSTSISLRFAPPTEIDALVGSIE